MKHFLLFKKIILNISILSHVFLVNACQTFTKSNIDVVKDFIGASNSHNIEIIKKTISKDLEYLGVDYKKFLIQYKIHLGRFFNSKIKILEIKDSLNMVVTTELYESDITKVFEITSKKRVMYKVSKNKVEFVTIIRYSEDTKKFHKLLAEIEFCLYGKKYAELIEKQDKGYLEILKKIKKEGICKHNFSWELQEH